MVLLNFRTSGHSYSTCSIDPKTCPDGYCDSLERLNPEGLCPQDCMPKGTVDYVPFYSKFLEIFVNRYNISFNVVCGL